MNRGWLNWLESEQSYDSHLNNLSDLTASSSSSGSSTSYGVSNSASGSSTSLSSNSSASMDNSVRHNDSSGNLSRASEDSNPFTIDVEAETEGLNRICEHIASMGNVLASHSTPTVVTNSRRVRSLTPVEVIDLSGFDVPSPAPRSARDIVPEAVIDLCTPEGASSRNRNRALQMGSAVVDVDDPSPPKRACTSMNQSQKDDPYSCPVCLEGVRNREPVSTKCGHVFCRACIDTAIRTTRKCPMCQKSNRAAKSQNEDPHSFPVCLESVRQREPLCTKRGHVFRRACIDNAIRTTHTTHKCPMYIKRLTAKSYFCLSM